jgi:hypothetical protein
MRPDPPAPVAAIRSAAAVGIGVGAAVGGTFGVLAVVIAYNLPNYRKGEKYFEPTSLAERLLDGIRGAAIGAAAMGLLVGVVLVVTAAAEVVGARTRRTDGPEVGT